MKFTVFIGLWTGWCMTVSRLVLEWTKYNSFRWNLHNMGNTNVMLNSRSVNLDDREITYHTKNKYISHFQSIFSRVRYFYFKINEIRIYIHSVGTRLDCDYDTCNYFNRETRIREGEHCNKFNRVGDNSSENWVHCDTWASLFYMNLRWYFVLFKVYISLEMN